MPHRSVATSVPARFEALRARHAALSEKIESEQTRVSSNDWYVRDLKRQKLRLKEEIEILKSVSSN